MTIAVDLGRKATKQTNKHESSSLFSSSQTQAHMRYQNGNDGWVLSGPSPHFKRNISHVSWPILIKFHVKQRQVGERLHKVFGLVGLELWLS